MAHTPSVGLHNGAVNGWGIGMGLGGDEVESELREDASAAYIVRVWIEAREIEGAPVTWRGSIEHVATGMTRYLTDLEEIERFIWPFLETMGVRFAERAE